MIGECETCENLPCTCCCREVSECRCPECRPTPTPPTPEAIEAGAVAAYAADHGITNEQAAKWWPGFRDDEPRQAERYRRIARAVLSAGRGGD